MKDDVGLGLEYIYNINKLITYKQILFFVDLSTPHKINVSNRIMRHAKPITTTHLKKEDALGYFMKKSSSK